MLEWITEADNPLASLSPAFPVAGAAVASWCAYKWDKNWARRVSIYVTLFIVSYSLVVRVLFMAGVLNLPQFLGLITPNVPTVFLALALSMQRYVGFLIEYRSLKTENSELRQQLAEHIVELRDSNRAFEEEDP